MIWLKPKLNPFDQLLISIWEAAGDGLFSTVEEIFKENDPLPISFWFKISIFFITIILGLSSYFLFTPCIIINKAKTFENLIRKIVREEIDYALRREIKSLKEDLRDELKPTITEHKERMVEVPEATKTSLKEKVFFVFLVLIYSIPSISTEFWYYLGKT